jgi:hypothetical protein
MPRELVGSDVAARVVACAQALSERMGWLPPLPREAVAVPGGDGAGEAEPLDADP